MSIFFRLHTDGTREPVALENAYAGPHGASCWLVGGGPSLAELPCERIAASPWPVTTLNLAGTGLLRPDLWTAYDPSSRFHRSVYLDGRVLKLLPARRATEFVPETTFKIADCPNTVFFERDRNRGFADFLAAGHTRIVDWNDSFVQAVDLLYRLGFRTVYVAGCEFRVRPSAEQIAKAESGGVAYDPARTLADFVDDCRAAGCPPEALQSLGEPRQYHFDEAKPLRSAVNTEAHYVRVLQYLRLSRRSMALEGLRLISVTPESRLNDFFPFEPVERVLERATAECGDPGSEPVRGLYTKRDDRMPPLSGPVFDVEPPGRVPPVTRAPARDGELLVEAEGVVTLTR